MTKVIAGMTTSIDGFVADEGGSIERLYPDLAALQGTAYMNALIAETGAVRIHPLQTDFGCVLAGLRHPEKRT
jgi:hypothetical protein